jgi:prolyl 4-hydroxylase
LDLIVPPKSLTVFLYLNDVPKGGGTHFSVLDKTVFPKRGRAVIWPSVLNEDPNVKDPRTDHEALPVEEGVKYGTFAQIG